MRQEFTGHNDSPTAAADRYRAMQRPRWATTEAVTVALDDLRRSRDDILAVASRWGVGGVRVFGSVASVDLPAVLARLSR